MFKYLRLILVLFLFIACAPKTPQLSKSATILIKTPKMKFYDKGFVSIFPFYTQLQVFSAGSLVLDLKVYEDRICKSTFKCLSPKAFNEEFLHSSYKEDFFKKLIEKKEKKIILRDKKNHILIKILKD